MQFFDLVNISERYLELVNPSTPEKTITLGRLLRLHDGSRVIDFGCGYGEAQVLWAEHFGIVGTGIDAWEHACERARRKVFEMGDWLRLLAIGLECGLGTLLALRRGTGGRDRFAYSVTDPELA
jgi:hypothetical protein